MSTITFDTLKYAERLERGGFTREQAKAEAEALVEVFDAGTRELTTRSDLKLEMASVTSDLRELRLEMNSKFMLLQWMLGLILASLVSLIAQPRPPPMRFWRGPTPKKYAPSWSRSWIPTRCFALTAAPSMCNR